MTIITDRFSGTVSGNTTDRFETGSGPDYFAAGYFAAHYFRASFFHGGRTINSTITNRAPGTPTAALTDRY